MSLLIKGVTNFLGLTDTPASYAGAAGYIAKVKAALDGLEFGNVVTQYQMPTTIIPDNPSVVGGLLTVGELCYRVRVAGKYVIIIENTATPYLRIIDVTIPASPILRGGYALGAATASVNGLAVAGKYIYVTTDTPDKLRILDWSNPSSPALVGEVAITGGANFWGIFVRGRYAYITHAGTTTGIDIVDISNPASPVVITTFNHADLSGASDICVIGNTAYVRAIKFVSLNVADPYAPAIIQSLVDAYTGGFPGGGIMQIIGSRAYIADSGGNKIRVIDVGNPAAMSTLGTKTDAVYLEKAMSLKVVGKWLFTTNYFGAVGYLSIWDVSDPTAITMHSAFTLPYNRYGPLDMAGKYVFTARTSGGRAFTVIQVWSLDVPAFMGSVIWADQIYTNDLFAFNLLEAPTANLGGRGIPESLTNTISIPLVLTQIVATAPDVAYVELSALYRTNIDFSKLAVKQARVIVSAIGDEAGAGKGIEIWNNTDGAAICEVTWDGVAQQNALAGALTTCNLRTAKDIYVRVKGSSATENITVDKVELQFTFA